MTYRGHCRELVVLQFVADPDPPHNDGGPGATPALGTRYTAPGPRQTIHLINGLDNLMQTSFIRRRLTVVETGSLAGCSIICCAGYCSRHP